MPRGHENALLTLMKKIVEQRGEGADISEFAGVLAGASG